MRGGGGINIGGNSRDEYLMSAAYIGGRLGITPY